MSGRFDKSGSSSEAPTEGEEQSPASESSHQFREGLGDHLKARAKPAGAGDPLEGAGDGGGVAARDCVPVPAAPVRGQANSV